MDKKLKIKEIFKKIQIKIELRKNKPLLWNQVYKQLSYQPVSYMSSMLDYQIEYLAGTEIEVIDFSCILYHENEVIGLWPFYIPIREMNQDVDVPTLNIHPPLFLRDCKHRIKKEYGLECLNIAFDVSKTLDYKNWYSEIPFINEFGMSDWHNAALKKEGSTKIQSDLYVDLSLSLLEIKAKYRRSYRSLISKGEKLWRIEIVRSPGSIVIWNEFRRLHQLVSNKITRSQLSWELQHQAIINHNAFLVLIRDNEGRMVGGGFFMHSFDEGVYAVGVYDRSLFDKPLGHVIQHYAISELKEIGCKWYRIGTRFYKGDHTNPTDKELSIATFKEGFSTHTLPKFTLIIHNQERI